MYVLTKYPEALRRLFFSIVKCFLAIFPREIGFCGYLFFLYVTILEGFVASLEGDEWLQIRE